MQKKILKALATLLTLLFFFFPSAEAKEAATKLQVVAEQANIRLKPDIGSIIIHQVSKGTVLESTGKKGEWYIIKLNPDESEEILGYVHESLVIVLEHLPKEEVKEEQRKVEEEREEQLPPKPAPERPPSVQPSKPRFDLYLYGGGSYISGGDLNKGPQGLADFYSHTHAVRGKGEVKPTHLSYVLGGELTFPLSSQLYPGIGLDYFFGEKESLIEFQKGSSTETLTTRPKIQALPLRLIISSYPLSNLYVKIGIEYYFAKCGYFYHFEKEEYWEEWKGEAKAQGFGLLGGLGFDWELSSVLSFTMEVTGRYAKISGFKGKDRHRDSTGLDFTEEGTLYFYQGKISSETSYPLLFIRKKKPTAWVSDPREAIIDFSGLSLKSGIKIRF